MVSKTRSKQDNKIKAIPKSKKSWPKWINIDLETNESSFEYNILTNSKHLWTDYKKYIYDLELVKCSLCDLIAKRTYSDTYSPPLYNYYVKYKDDLELSCEDRCVLYIIK